MQFAPEQWSAWIWFLHAFAAWYVAAFVYYWFRLRRLEQEDDARYQRVIGRFPGGFFAKMMGRGPRQ